MLCVCVCVCKRKDGKREGGEQKIRNDGIMSDFRNKENRILKRFRKFHSNASLDRLSSNSPT